jgi:glycine/D-amino acid oxidase-like deaminating enzyme
MYLRDRVSDIGLQGGRIAVAHLESGQRWSCGALINATGTASRNLAARIGIDLPVRARKRCVFVFQCPAPITGVPLVIDPSGLWFRPEGERFICGLPPRPDPDVENDDFDVPAEIFDAEVWPALAARVPAFEAIRLAGTWAGHYDYNVFDQNAFIGPVPGIANFLLASGFSGHGLQQAPAVGRGLAELIVEGRYRSLDLSPLGYDRYLRNQPLIERNVI